jgi:circadian clock protein KaiB
MTAKPKSHRPRAPHKARRKEGFVLRLFIAGMSSRSVAAIHSIKTICEQHLEGKYQLEIVDLYRQPARAKKDQIVAAPTLIKQGPLPLKRIVGSMADQDRLMHGLNVKKK